MAEDEKSGEPARDKNELQIMKVLVLRCIICMFKSSNVFASLNCLQSGFKYVCFGCINPCILLSHQIVLFINYLTQH